MKKIEAIIKPFKLEDVKEALDALNVNGMTISEVSEYDPHKGRIEFYRGSQYRTEFHPMTKVEIVVSDRIAKRAAKAIVKATRTAKPGESKVRVCNVETAIRIRTGERGDRAL